MKLYCIDCHKVHEQQVEGLEGTFPGICGVCKSKRRKLK